ncbi:MAG: RHS repeat-associated core domain-containing protein, partial [Bacteroidota bacterium]|nr:RHS repeat-associated core domain-containing protein [Bacteroidota bacterium]
KNKSTCKINYTWNNLPELVCMAQDGLNVINFVYDAVGNKLCKIIEQDHALGEAVDYAGSFVYEDKELSFILMEEGRIVMRDDRPVYEYFLKDHLGNTRVVIHEDGHLLQDNSYYPFGMKMEGLSHSEEIAPENKYLYNGKELHEDFNLDWYDYGARFYDAKIARFHALDPLTEKNHTQSGFVYAANNPIVFMDYMGLDTLNINIGNQTIDRITVKDSESHTFVVVNGDNTTTTTLDINDDGLVKFPASGDGFGRYGTEDEGGDHYLKSGAAAALFGLTAEMTNEQDGLNVDLGDMSAADGTAPGGDHKTHGGPNGYSGVCVDYRYLDKDGQSYQGYANDKKFNAWNNGYFLKKAGEWGFTKNYISNQKNVWSFKIRSGATGNIKTTIYPMNVNGKKIGGHGHHGHLTYIKK